MAKLYVIAGHGAGDPGAIRAGQTEAERVRALAKVLKERGGSQVEVLDTSRDWYRDGGINTLSLPAGAMLIELHRDSFDDPNVQGAHIEIQAGLDPDGFDIALAANLTAIFPGRSETIKRRTDLANANRAAARGINYRLAEVGFISNVKDRAIFDSRLNEIADAILNAAGIKETKVGWMKDKNGWWYWEADGSWPKNAWREVNGYWYYFGNDGYAMTGWQYIKGEWYYLLPEKKDNLPECAMVTGWLYDNDEWYYLTESGAMAKSCTMKISGKTYAFNDHGVMFSEAVPVDKNGALILS